MRPNSWHCSLPRPRDWAPEVDCKFGIAGASWKLASGARQKNRQILSGLWEMPTSVIQEKGPPKTTSPFKEGIPLYHRSGDKPHPTTLDSLILAACMLGRQPWTLKLGFVTNIKDWEQLAPCHPANNSSATFRALHLGQGGPLCRDSRRSILRLFVVTRPKSDGNPSGNIGDTGKRFSAKSFEEAFEEAKPNRIYVQRTPPTRTSLPFNPTQMQVRPLLSPGGKHPQTRVMSVQYNQQPCLGTSGLCKIGSLNVVA